MHIVFRGKVLRVYVIFIGVCEITYTTYSIGRLKSLHICSVAVYVCRKVYAHPSKIPAQEI